MARHWSAYVAVSERQARALDKMADAHGIYDGRSLLMQIDGCSSSKLSKYDRPTIQRLVDKAFAQFGRDAS